MKKNIILSLILLIALLFAGCQSTPEQSAVESKADGLNKDVIDNTLEKGVTRSLDLPKHWRYEEKRSNDRVKLSADIPITPVTVGNLPVIEIKNKVMTDDDLRNLVEHFVDEETLYVPEINTKEVYEKVKNRIESAEGAYADPSMRSYNQEIAKDLEKAIELAPQKNAEPQAAEVKFDKKPEDKAYSAAYNQEVSQKTNLECYFSADIGEGRDAHIEAETFNSKANNVSSFLWETGMDTFSASTLQDEAAAFAGVSENSSDSGYYKDWKDLLQRFETAIDKETLTLEEGLTLAQTLLSDLNINDMELLSTQRTLWFPKGAIPENIRSTEDVMWQADLEKAKQGYEYTFSRAINGLPIDQMDGSAITDEGAGSYSPPFPVEKIIVAVTEDGIKSFSWNGICEKVAVVAENTKLLAFEKIQDKLFDQMYYRYAAMGQPSDSKTEFTYNVVSEKLGYTYVTAYEKPENAWLLPCWFFTVKEHVNDSAESGKSYERWTMEFMINAFDGGLIGRQ